MQVFDQIHLQDMERRDWQLWVLALVMILILAGGVALLLYFFISPQSITLSGRTTLRGIFGFCVLTLLFVGYLIERQLVIGRLRRELRDERQRNIQLRSQDNKELLQTLFGRGQFCDRLALELKRAENSKLPLSGLTISLEVAPTVSVTDEVFSTFGEAVKAMMHKLRGEDSIYQFTSGIFGILLPGTGSQEARRVAVRVAEGMTQTMGVSKRYSFDIRVTSFPEQAKTAQEMEAMMSPSPGR
jgi:GGDEF domain-containing protein